MAAPAPPQLERMASELKCSICLGLYKQAASLSCNHCFCNSCIVQSLKRISCCPICKVPATPREIRFAPQMDSLVAIFRGMEDCAGVSLCPTQPSQPHGFGTEQPAKTSKLIGRRERKTRQSSNNGAQMETENVGSSRKRRRCKAEERSERTARNPGSVGRAKERAEEAPSLPKRKKMRGRPRKEPAGGRTGESCKISSPDASPPNAAFKEGDAEIVRQLGGENDLPKDPGAEGRRPPAEVLDRPRSSSADPLEQVAPVQSPRNRSIGDQPIQLSPFFWVGHEVVPSQYEPVTQFTQTQATAAPARPSFSDLKGSDDDQSQDEGASHGRLPDPEGYDSDAFVWTQRPCSPELSSSPLKTLKNDSRPQPFSPEFSSIPFENTINGLRPQHCSQNTKFEDELGGKEPRTASEEEPKSPLKSAGGAPAEEAPVEATQTPQVHQEPSRMTKGTPLQRLASLKQTTGRPSSRTRRRLKSGDSLPSTRIGVRKSLRKPGGPETGGQKRKRGRPSKKSRRSREEADGAALTKGVQPHANADGRSPVQELRSHDQADTIQPQEMDVGARAAESDENSPHESENNGPKCVFCGSVGDSQVAGPMMEYKSPLPSQGQTRLQAVNVHKLCAEWAPDVYFSEEVPKNLANEVRRGQRMKCSSCGKRGAALGCCNKRCKKSFHYPCGRATPGCKWDENDFVMFCPHHAECTFPKRKRCRAGLGGDHVYFKEQDARGVVTSKKKGTEAASAVAQLERWPPGPACKFVLCGSGLDKQMKGQLGAFKAATGASLVRKWSPSVTHVVTGANQKGAAKRTLKSLMAVLVGKRLMKFEWIRDCMAAGHILPVDEYEADLEVSGCTGGLQRGRALAAAGAPKLLEGISFHFFGEFNSMSKEDLSSLITAGNGTILHRKPLPLERSLSHDRELHRASQPIRKIVIYDGEGGDAAVDAESMAAQVGASAVPHTWLLDSIAACQLQPSG